jgi:hypothetical protein
VTQYISLSILDDGVYEQPETFTIRLLPAEQVESDIAGVGTIGSIGEVVVTIAGPNNGRFVSRYSSWRIGRRRLSRTWQ